MSINHDYGYVVIMCLGCGKNVTTKCIKLLYVYSVHVYLVTHIILFLDAVYHCVRTYDNALYTVNGKCVDSYK